MYCSAKFNSFVGWIPTSAVHKVNTTLRAIRYLDTVQVSVKREETLANTTNKLKCDTNNLGNVHNLCILLSGREGNR
jgi:hypothetical protein